NADMRLTEIGHEIGLVTKERYQRFVDKKATNSSRSKATFHSCFPKGLRTIV
ncbi:MAG: hypothetical protein IJ032_01885, partial [Clostridia bacterium]|nr:hypothetical protein [Clostridia bacterium]